MGAGGSTVKLLRARSGCDFEVLKNTPFGEPKQVLCKAEAPEQLPLGRFLLQAVISKGGDVLNNYLLMSEAAEEQGVDIALFKAASATIPDNKVVSVEVDILAMAEKRRKEEEAKAALVAEEKAQQAAEKARKEEEAKKVKEAQQGKEELRRNTRSANSELAREGAELMTAAVAANKDECVGALRALVDLTQRKACEAAAGMVTLVALQLFWARSGFPQGYLGLAHLFEVMDAEELVPLDVFLDWADDDVYRKIVQLGDEEDEKGRLKAVIATTAFMSGVQERLLEDDEEEDGEEEEEAIDAPQQIIRRR
jgi:hypothetical protein